MSARGKRRLASRFAAESHPPARLLFMRPASMKPTGNRGALRLCNPEGTDRLLTTSEKFLLQIKIIFNDF